MTELEQSQAKLIMKMAKQLGELHWCMGYLSGVYIYCKTHQQLVDGVNTVLERYEEMGDLDK